MSCCHARHGQPQHRSQGAVVWRRGSWLALPLLVSAPTPFPLPPKSTLPAPPLTAGSVACSPRPPALPLASPPVRVSANLLRLARTPDDSLFTKVCGAREQSFSAPNPATAPVASSGPQPAHIDEPCHYKSTPGSICHLVRIGRAPLWLDSLLAGIPPFLVLHAFSVRAAQASPSESHASVSQPAGSARPSSRRRPGTGPCFSPDSPIPGTHSSLPQGQGILPKPLSNGQSAAVVSHLLSLLILTATKNGTTVRGFQLKHLALRSCMTCCSGSALSLHVEYRSRTCT